MTDTFQISSLLTCTCQLIDDPANDQGKVTTETANEVASRFSEEHCNRNWDPGEPINALVGDTVFVASADGSVATVE